MTRLLAAPAALAFALALATPATAEDGPPGLAEHLERIGHLPANLVKAKKTDGEVVEALFLAALARLPEEKERETAAKHLAAAKDRAEAARDLAWALVNTKEFLKLRGMDKDIAASLRLLNTLADKWGMEKEKK